MADSAFDRVSFESSPEQPPGRALTRSRRSAKFSPPT